MELCERVRQRRLELGLTQDELAKRMNYSSRTSINKIELGRPISQKIIVRLAKALETSPSYLMGWLDEDLNSSYSTKQTYNVEAKEKDSQIVKTIANNLKAFRESRNLTTVELANELHIDPSLYLQYESGEKEIPFAFVKNIADYFGISLDSFFNSVDVQYGFNSHVLVTVDKKAAKLHSLWIDQVGEFDWTQDEFQQIVNYAKFLISQRKDDK